MLISLRNILHNSLFYIQGSQILLQIYTCIQQQNTFYILSPSQASLTMNTEFVKKKNHIVHNCFMSSSYLKLVRLVYEVVCSRISSLLARSDLFVWSIISPQSTLLAKSGSLHNTSCIKIKKKVPLFSLDFTSLIVFQPM